jgi:hypothetical protein
VTARSEQIAAADWRNPFHQVLAYVGLGDQDRALEALEKMAPQGPLRLGWALACPELYGLRDHPKVKALRKTVGLTE